MPIQKIERKWSVAPILQGEFESKKRAVENAIRSHADLSGAILNNADLRQADLRWAIFSGANLSGANLSGADMSGSYFDGVDLRGAILNDADLRYSFFRNADLRNADLREADLRYTGLKDADMRGADMRGSIFSGAIFDNTILSGTIFSDSDFLGVPKIKNIHQKLLEAVSSPGALDMGICNGCKTIHCRARWINTLAGDAGKAMEWCLGTHVAATMIYIKSDPTLERVPNLYANNEDAMADIKRLAQLEAQRNNHTGD